MSTTTANYSLVKPATTDKVDITVLDADLDTIDTQLYAKVSKESLVLNVKDYGAVGDGSTDNTTAF